MKTPRVKGGALKTALRMVRFEPFRTLVNARMRGQHGIERLLGLPYEARLHLDTEPRPIAGAPPRSFGGRDLGPLPRVGHRERARDLVEAYATGRRSPVEVLERIASRIEGRRFGEAHHSPFVCLDLDVARLAARESEARYRRRAPLGPLDGVPVPIKDHQDMAGLPTRGGTSWHVEPAAKDGVVAERLRAAGAILYGKTHATEWGLSPAGFSAHHDMPRNVYRGDHGAGGSSTGTGVSVALGFAPVGLGSDGGGSVRIPSALSGLFGLKPTFARIGGTGDLWAGGTVHHTGPLGQSVEDLVEVLATLGSARDPDEPMCDYAPSLPAEEVTANFRRALGRGVRGATIGLWRWAFSDAKPEIARAVMEGVRALEREGATVREVDVLYGEHHQAIGVLGLGVEGVGMLGDVLANFGEQTGDDVKFVLTALSNIKVREYMAARQTRAALRRSLAKTLSGIDLLCMPTTNLLAPRYALDEGRQAILDDDAVRNLTRYSFIANLTGLPAGTVPVAMHDGFPVGLQLLGDAWDEASVLAGMAQLERTGIAALPAPRGYERLSD